MAENGMNASGIEVDLAELIALRQRALGLAAGRPRASRDQHSGSRASPFRGRGMEYAESRPYAAGDDVRHIDWRVTARSGRVHSKLFQPERERITAIVADTAPTMAFGTRACFKSVQAARIAALLVWLALAEGDRLAAATGGSRGLLLPPTGGRRGALRALETLVDGYRTPLPATAAAPLAGMLDRLARLLCPGSHVLLLLDPRSVDADTVAALARLRAHHDLVAALLVDPLEAGPPPSARYPIVAGGLRRLLALDETPARDAWQAHFSAQRQQALASLQRCGVRASAVLTSDDPLQALRGLLSGRASRPVAA
jgi:uncharacterized protein (DUF58 family)